MKDINISETGSQVLDYKSNMRQKANSLVPRNFFKIYTFLLKMSHLKGKMDLINLLKLKIKASKRTAKQEEWTLEQIRNFP